MKILFVLRSVFLIPHFIVFKCCKKHDVLCKDLDSWRRLCPNGNNRNHTYLFFYMMCHFKEFRNLFYLRLGNIKYLLRIFCRPLDSLYLISRNVGPGLFIQHGFSTILGVESMGSNCWINQQVTVGHTEKGRPKIGNNVKIMTGAKVLGDVTVGDNVTIGAGAVIVKDVPPNCVVVGSKAYIVKRNGKKVREEL